MDDKKDLFTLFATHWADPVFLKVLADYAEEAGDHRASLLRDLANGEAHILLDERVSIRSETRFDLWTWGKVEGGHAGVRMTDQLLDNLASSFEDAGYADKVRHLVGMYRSCWPDPDALLEGGSRGRTWENL